MTTLFEETPSPAKPPTTAPAVSPRVPPVHKGKRPYPEMFENWLREQGIPYIAVDEAKKALFAGTHLKSFDFVVYRPEGVNYLVKIMGRRDGRRWIKPDDRADLKQWQDVFGDGFKAIFLLLIPDDKGPFFCVATGCAVKRSHYKAVVLSLDGTETGPFDELFAPGKPAKPSP